MKSEVGVAEAFKKAIFSNYFNFKANSSRKEYWFFILDSFIIELVLNLPFFIWALLNINQETGELPSKPIIIFIFFILSLIYAILIVIPSLAAIIRRLHDAGKNGWWILIGLIPLIGLIILFIFLIKESVIYASDGRITNNNQLMLEENNEE